MLSYRHSFHAGNFADVIKHVVLVEILQYLTKKDKAFAYIDTHAGAGLFDLESESALKLQEYRLGVGRLTAQALPELAAYFAVIDAYNAEKTLRYYPGSPLFAHYFLRSQDKAWLFELHPQDFEHLRENMRHHRQVKVICQDGLQGLAALLPPLSRRGLVLIDPSYEVKSEYEQVVSALASAYKRFASGVYALWYPVVERSRIDLLEKQLLRSGIKDIQRFELGVLPDSNERGMTAAGMIVINPPWGLFEKMLSVLPKLVHLLGADHGFFKCDVVADE